MKTAAHVIVLAWWFITATPTHGGFAAIASHGPFESASECESIRNVFLATARHYQRGLPPRLHTFVGHCIENR